MTITFETFEHRTGVEEVAIIENKDGSYTSMSKAEYDRRQAEQSTLMVPTDNYLTAPAIMESTQPDEADLTEGNN